MWAITYVVEIDVFYILAIPVVFVSVIHRRYRCPVCKLLKCLFNCLDCCNHIICILSNSRRLSSGKSPLRLKRCEKGRGDLWLTVRGGRG